MGRDQIFPKWPPLEEHILMVIPETFASNVLPLTVSDSHSIFPGDPLRTVGRSDLDSDGVFALPSDPAHTKTCVSLSRVEFPFPPVHEALVCKPHWPSVPNAPGMASPNTRSPGMGS